MKRIGKIIAASVTILILILLLGVASSRTVRAAVATLVTIANTSANPVPATDVGPQQPYVASCQNAYDPTAYLNCKIVAPPGKRFVVETVSMYLASGLGVTPTRAPISISSTAGFSIFYLNVPFVGIAAGDDHKIFYTSRPFRGSIEGLPALCGAEFSSDTSATLTCSMSGYLVDVP